MQRVDACDLHRLHRPRIDARHDYPVPDTVGRELGAGMKDDFAAMGQEQNGLVLLNPTLDDGGRDLGSAGAGRGDEQHLAALAEGSIDATDNIELIGTQLDHDQSRQLPNRHDCGWPSKSPLSNG